MKKKMEYKLLPFSFHRIGKLVKPTKVTEDDMKKAKAHWRKIEKIRKNPPLLHCCSNPK